MRAMALVLLGCWASVLIGPSEASAADKDTAVGKPKDLIVGTWEPVKPKEGKKGTITFTKQGGLIVELAGTPKIEGKYKFLEDGLMEVEVPAPAGLDLPAKKQKLKVKVTKDELITTDEKGQEDKFKKKS